MRVHPYAALTGAGASAITYALPMCASRRTVTVLLTCAAALAPAPALAAGGNQAASAAYLRADARLAQTAAAHIAVGRSAIAGVLARVRGDCPLGAAGSPQNPQSTELSNEVIGGMVTAAIHPDVASIRDFIRTAGSLRWSSGALTAAVHAYVAKLRALVALSQPDVCADVASWSKSGFRTLPPTTLRFSPRFMESWVALGELPEGLAPFEGAQRGLVRAAETAEGQLSEFEAHEVETWGRIMDVLDLSP